LKKHCFASIFLLSWGAFLRGPGPAYGGCFILYSTIIYTNNSQIRSANNGRPPKPYYAAGLKHVYSAPANHFCSRYQICRDHKIVSANYTGVYFAPGGFDRNIARNRMVIVRKHSGRVWSLSSGGGAHVTMVSCISAAGVAPKLYFIMKGKLKPKKTLHRLFSGVLVSKSLT
jgi:hypothetical protein